MTYGYQLSELIDPTDKVAATVTNVINAVLAETVGDMITVASPVHIGTGGGCSAAVADVLYRVEGETPILIGQLVQWEGRFGDVAPTDPWLDLAVGWYPAGRLYDAGPDDDTLGDSQPLDFWHAESSPECLAEMINGDTSVINILAGTVGIVPLRF